MPLNIDVVGWEDYDGDRHAGIPDDLSGVYGQLVHVHDDITGEDQHFWAFVPEPFGDWDDWYDYINDLADMYGMSTA